MRRTCFLPNPSNALLYGMVLSNNFTRILVGTRTGNLSHLPHPPSIISQLQPITVNPSNQHSVLTCARALSDQTIDVIIHDIALPLLQYYISPKLHALSLNINCQSLLLSFRSLVPLVAKSSNPHIIIVCAPLNLDPDWNHHHFSLSFAHNFNSFATVALAEELRDHKIAVNSIWTRNMIFDYHLNIADQSLKKSCISSEVLTKAIHHISKQNSTGFTGNQLYAEDLLNEATGNRLFPSFLTGKYKDSPYAVFRKNPKHSVKVEDCLNVLQSMFQKYLKESHQNSQSLSILLKVSYGPVTSRYWVFKIDGSSCDLMSADGDTERILMCISEDLLSRVFCSDLNPMYLSFSPWFNFRGPTTVWSMVEKCLKMGQEHVSAKFHSRSAELPNN